MAIRVLIVEDQAADTSPFVIDQAGLVGIKNMTPIVELDVTGTASSTLLRVGGANASGLTFSPTAIIGASAASSTLEILAPNAPSYSAELWLANAGQNNWTIGADRTLNALTITRGNEATNLLIINSSDNWGINDSTPSQRIDMDGTNVQMLAEESTTEFLRVGVGETAETSIIGWDDADSLELGVYSSPTDTTISSLMTILSTGNVGIGTTTPASALTLYNNSTAKDVLLGFQFANVNYNQLTLNGSVAVGEYNLLSSASDKNLYINRPTGSDIKFRENNGTDQMTIKTSTGNVGIGTTTPNYKLAVQSTSDGNMFQLYDTDGNCLQNPESGGITTTCTSDLKYKENVRDSGSMLDYFTDFVIREYEVKATGDTRIGPVAQELEITHPELVRDITSTSTYQLQTGTSTEMDENGVEKEVPVYETREATSTSKFVEMPSIWQVIKAVQDVWSKVAAIFRFEEGKVTGITLFDTATDEAHCVQITNGRLLASGGECI